MFRSLLCAVVCICETKIPIASPPPLFPIQSEQEAQAAASAAAAAIVWSQRQCDLLNSTALWLCSSVEAFGAMQRAQSSVHPDTHVGFGAEEESGQDAGSAGLTSFAVVADWYSSDGFRAASWLELLDSKKWQYVLLNADSRQ